MRGAHRRGVGRAVPPCTGPWGGGPTRELWAGGRTHLRSGAERSCCLCVAAACGAPRGAQRPLTSGSAGSKKVGF